MRFPSPPRSFALYKPACSTAFACFKIDESYFGAKRVRGKRDRGAANKTSVFGMLKRDGRVYTQIVKNCSANELMLILSQYSKLDSSTIYYTLIVGKLMTD